jgi:putative spermidine/putrescine transport system permease protein
MSKHSARALLIPVVLPVVFVVGGGLGSTLLQSVGLLPLIGPARLTGENFAAGGNELPLSIGVSLGIASAATLLAAIIGGAIALAVVAGGWLGRVVGATSAAAVTIPHLIAAAAIGLLIANSGFLPRLLHIAPNSWPDLVGSPWWIAVIIEYAWKESAFVGLVVVGTLATRVSQFDETAALLGASRWVRVRMVFLPLAAPSLIIASTISFVYTLGSYEVAWLLGRTYPEPLAVMAVRLFNGLSVLSRPGAAAIAMITVLLSGLAVTVGLLAARRTAVWR